MYSFQSFFDFPRRSPLLIALTGCLLAACGGGTGTGSRLAPQSGKVVGTAAYGAPLSGARIEVLDAKGRTATTFANEEGEYQVQVADFEAPLRVSASAESGDSVRTYRAISETAPKAGQVERINVTPLTDAVVTMVSSDGLSPAEFDQAAALSKMDRQKLQAAHDSVKASVREIAAAAGVADFDPEKTPFKADGLSPGDQVLDAVRVEFQAKGVSILPLPGLDSASAATEAAVPVAKSLSVVVTSHTLPLPNTLTIGMSWDTLPFPRPVTLMPLFSSWAARINACFALSPEQRVSVNAEGKAVALLGACAALQGASSATMAHPQYLHNGQSFIETWGDRLRNQIPAKARVAMPQLVGFYIGRTLTRLPGGGDNLAPLLQNLVVRLSWSSPQGGGSFQETARRTGLSLWQLSGNLQQFDASVTPFVTRDEDVSTRGFVPASGPDAGKDVGKFSSIASRLSLRFNPAGPNAQDVYAVRITGPGLPAAGVVLARASTCGMDRALGFYSNNGTLPPVKVGDALPLASRQSAIFTLAVVPTSSTRGGYFGQDFFNDYRGRNRDGSPSSDPGVRVAYPQFDVDGIALFSEYIFEVFSLPQSTGQGLVPQVDPAVPSARFTTYMLTRPLAPTVAARLPWATLSAPSLDYVNPSAGFAGEIDGLELSWQLPKAAPAVVSAYVLGAGTSAQGLSRRVLADRAVTPPGAQSIRLSAAGLKNGLGQVCQPESLPAFSATSGSREVAVRQTLASGLVFRTAAFHAGR